MNARAPTITEMMENTGESGTETGTHEMPPFNDEKALDALVELMHDVPERQLHSVAIADSKLVQILAAAGIVIGLAINAIGTSDISLDAKVCLSVAVGLFLLTAISAGWGLWPRPYEVARKPNHFFYEPKYRNQPAAVVKEHVLGMVADSYQRNVERLGLKKRAIRCALIWTVLEVVCVALAVLPAPVALTARSRP